VLPGSDAKAGTLVQVHEDGIREAAKSLTVPGSGPAPSRLLIDVFQRGSAAGARPRQAGDGLEYLTYHMTDDANRLQDILTAIAYAGPRGAVRLQCGGSPKFAALCTAAVALSRTPVSLELSGKAEKEGLKAPDLPGFERLGGVAETQRRAEASLARNGSLQR
jgi:hypothetical protein